MLCRLRGDIVADRVHDGDFALKHDRAENFKVENMHQFSIQLMKHLFDNILKTKNKKTKTKNKPKSIKIETAEYLWNAQKRLPMKQTHHTYNKMNLPGGDII